MPRSDQRFEIVLAGGGATTLLALAGVLALAHTGTNIMGWYGNYIIPVGALLVGAVAASGYGIASWLTGLKMSRGLMWSVAGQLVLSYFVAQYVEYRSFDLGMGFWAWFDAVTRAFAWTHEHDGGTGSPFGVFGYAMRALEIGGFVVGGVAVPFALRSKPYCDPCRTYMRTRWIAWIPHGLSTMTTAGPYAGDPGRDALTAIARAADTGDRAAFEHVLDDHASPANKRKTNKLPARIAIALVRCPRCAIGRLAPSLHQGRGKQTRTTPLAPHALTGDRVRALFDSY